ncbi:MAG: divergent polysaccharide deacetylase family protein [Methylobacteriaceae bacterium]|nr:divergent polysaccharide deacetylase family protein [Methylobacteriaceae bacterium]
MSDSFESRAAADRDRLVDAPLGVGPAAPAKRRRFGARAALGATLGLAAIALGAALVMVEVKAPGGRPQAVARIETAPPPAPAAPAAAAAQPAPAAGGVTLAPRSAGVIEIEGQSGVKVHRPAGSGPPGALIIQVPETPAVMRLTPAPDKRLVERGPHGPIPRIGADGARPADVYARPVMTSAALKPGAPRIAIYVGGLGLAAGPTQAAMRLPAAVTLAFAPYGGNLSRDVAAAREAGHETLLQAPMEPIDYPANDPGPHTLIAADPAAKNVDRLHWHMSRFPGYVGVAAFLGGRFLADEAALAPVMKEIAERGLFYVEEVAAGRSQAARVAAGLRLPLLRADVVIDRADRPEAIDAALAELEKIARAKGVAVGAASALPNALDKLQRWAGGLEARGVALIPLSAAAQAAPVAAAGR